MASSLLLPDHVLEDWFFVAVLSLPVFLPAPDVPPVLLPPIMVRVLTLGLESDDAQVLAIVVPCHYVTDAPALGLGARPWPAVVLC